MTTKVRSLHNKTTSRGIAVCEAAGVEFWSLAPGPGKYWGILDGQMYRVDHSRRHQRIYVTLVNILGRDIGHTTTHPAPAGV